MRTDIIIPVVKPMPGVFDRCLKAIFKYTNNYNLIISCSYKGQVRNINSGLARAKSLYVVILDWDVVVGRDWLNKLIKAMDDDPTIGIMGAKMIGKYATWKNSPKIKKGVNDINTLAGGCIIFRNIGLKWDEKFPSGYWADSDFVRQYKELGFRVCSNGDVEVDHATHTSTELMETDLYWMMEKGKEIYKTKWGDNKL